MSVRGRIKRAVREAIAASGGIDGAARTVDKQRSWVGDWNNRNNAATPNQIDAHTLDEVALVETGRAPILEARAAELGYCAIRLPECEAGASLIALELGKCASEFGDVAREATAALEDDGKVSPKEEQRIVLEIDEAVQRLQSLRALVINSNQSGPVSLSDKAKAQG